MSIASCVHVSIASCIEAKRTYTFALNSRATGKIKQNYSFISGRAHRNLKIKTLRVSQSIYKLLKKVWNITFALIFYTYFFIIFTWVLHFLKGCSFPYILQKTAWKSIRGDQNYSLSNAAGVKIKSCRNVLSGLTNVDSCNFWSWPLPYSTMSISIIPQSISKQFSI